MYYVKKNQSYHSGKSHRRNCGVCENVLRKLDEQVALRGQSKSTFQNYSRRIALLVIHFNDLPENIDEDQNNEYLAALARDPKLHRPGNLSLPSAPTQLFLQK